MTERGIPTTTWIAGLLSLVAFTAYVFMHYDTTGAYQVLKLAGFSRVQFLALAVTGWLLALIAFWPLAERSQKSGLVFAFLILALMIFFVHETYQYKGKVRLFPLIIGYTGIVLSSLDILTLTNTTLGHIVNRATGSALVPEDVHDRSVSREIIVCSAMCACVGMIYAFGFLLGGALFVALWMLIGGRKTILQSLLGGIATFIFVYLLFELILRYELHRGIWTIWFWETYVR